MTTTRHPGRHAWLVCTSLVSVLTAGVARADETSPPAAGAPQPDTVRLHVEAPEGTPISVQGRPNDGYEWTPVCGGSCDRPVRLDWEYRVRGEGIKASDPFVLSSGGQTADVKVDPASKGWFIFGIAAVVAGGGFLLPLGLDFMLVGSVLHEVNTTSSETQIDSGLFAAGVVMTVTGAVLTVIGGVAALSNWSTHARQVAPSGALAPRRPMWVAAGTRISSSLPVPIQTPVFAFSF